ncbi:glycosyltransferase [Alteromonas sp. 345S023]|uniref:Glycosyltransferase n=1 Tax=Alteromonas profundi TaxID=2696062 RepID=A0A7X5LL82_9ALTE|nr:glycosyltransferase [Alteromonas profundi]
MQTSFIIPHKGREEMLIQTLESIRKQSVPCTTYEVIIVSQNKAISQSLSAFTESLNFSVIYNDESNTISHSRNVGAANAKGEFLAFLDADVALSENWLAEMQEILNASSHIALVSAMQINSKDAPPLEKIRTALSNAELDTEVSFLPGRNLFLRKSTFNRAGKFPEHLLTCEDYYFTDKVNEIGDLHYTSKAQYVHIGEDKSFIPMWKKEIWRGQSNLASLKGRHIPLREWPSFIVPFAVTLSIVAATVALLLAHTAVALALFILAALPLSAYILRLKKLTGHGVSVGYCACFYLLYFPARAIGTLLGVRGAVGSSTHS